MFSLSTIRKYYEQIRCHTGRSTDRESDARTRDITHFYLVLMEP